MSFNASITMTSPAQSSKLVPEEEQTGVQNYADLLNIARKHELGEEARRDLFSKGARLIRKTKPILLRHAVEPDGCFKRTWNRQSTARRAVIEKEVHKVAPWLLSFEETWATRWFLKKLIDQRVHDGNRTKKKEKDMETELSWETEEQRTAECKFRPKDWTLEYRIRMY
jgi:hypothetical protein